MANKIVRNSDYYQRENPVTGKCSRFGKEATVTTYFRCNQACKTDVDITPRYVGMKCSLLERTNEASFSSCMETCHLVVKEIL